MKRAVLSSFLLILLFSGCAEVVQVGTTIGQGTGALSVQDKNALDQLATQTAKAARPMTDQEEYYLGRAVAATILNQYRLYNDNRLISYLNEIGQAAALASDRPLTYGGYHFAVLDTDEINALSCPGGIIFITRGMLSQAKKEDEIAAVLAHEAGHVNHRDGVAAIQRSRWIQVVSLLGSQAARKVGGAELNQLVSLFQGSVDDVVKTILVNGYSREQEAAADQSALTFLNRLGYNPYALPDYLERLSKTQPPSGGRGILATHPGINERISADTAKINQNHWPKTDNPARDKRFQQTVGSWEKKG